MHVVRGRCGERRDVCECGAAAFHASGRAGSAGTQKELAAAFFQPAFALALAAVLLLTVGYQNLIQLPRLRNQLAQAETPAVLH